MKKLTQTFQVKLAIIMALLIAQANLFAQIDIDIDLGKKEWYENPWVWVGVAAFLLILVLLGRKK